jgi:hypothetical protein
MSTPPYHDLESQLQSPQILKWFYSINPNPMKQHAFVIVLKTSSSL